MFGATNRFKPRVRVELAEDVLNVIVDSGAADMKLVGNAAGRAAFCQEAKNLDLSCAKLNLTSRDDIFVADGSKWTYTSLGSEPKFIAQSNLRPTDLRFGDFNNDRKTDIFFVSGNDWRIIKGGGPGTSEFLRVAITPNVQGLVVADFDGDSHADVARDVSSKWMYSARGRGGFITLRNAPSGQKIAARYVGNFDGNKKADVIVWDSVWFGIAPGGGDPVVRISWQGMR